MQNNNDLANLYRKRENKTEGDEDDEDDRDNKDNTTREDEIRAQQQARANPRRLIVLLVFLVIAALPLVWFGVDPRAGDTLLYLTRLLGK